MLHFVAATATLRSVPLARRLVPLLAPRRNPRLSCTAGSRVKCCVRGTPISKTVIMLGTLAVLATLNFTGVHSDSLLVRREDVTYSNGAVALAATLQVPQRASRLPAVVIVHGSGPSDRTNPWTTAYADALARSGIVVLYPDKRGSGKSTGDWRTASFSDLAADAAAGVDLLRSRPEVDVRRIGVIGFSQGGYVVSILAAEDSTISFAAVVSGGVATLAAQMVDEIALDAAASSPLTPAEENTLRALYGRAFEFARTGRGWTALREDIARAAASNVRLAQVTASLPSDSSHWAFRWIRRTSDFDPLPYWRRARKPVVFLYGGRDENVRAQASIEKLWDAVGSKAPNFVVLMFQGNRHALFREDALAFLARWIADGGAS